MSVPTTSTSTSAPASAPAPTPFAPPPLSPIPPAPPSLPVDGQPLARRPKNFFSGRFGLIFGLVVVILTVVAIALASAAPLLVNHSAVPSGMTKVYDGVPNDGAAWSAATGCSHIANGLDVNGSNQNGCQFLPSENADLLSRGFYLKVTLAPDASVTNTQLPLVALGNDVFVAFTPAGEYLICTGTCDTLAGDTRVTAFTSAWHADGYTPNSFELVYQPGGDNGQNVLVLFVNGQQTRTVDLNISSGADLVLAAADAGPGEPGEAIYTHVTLYTTGSQGG